MLRMARAARAAVKFCDAAACSSCELAREECAFLRQKARFCIWLSVRVSNKKIRGALEKLGSDLIAESGASKEKKPLSLIGNKLSPKSFPHGRVDRRSHIFQDTHRRPLGTACGPLWSA